MRSPVLPSLVLALVLLACRLGPGLSRPAVIVLKREVLADNLFLLYAAETGAASEPGSQAVWLGGWSRPEHMPRDRVFMAQIRDGGLEGLTEVLRLPRALVNDPSVATVPGSDDLACMSACCRSTMCRTRRSAMSCGPPARGTAAPLDRCPAHHRPVQRSEHVRRVVAIDAHRGRTDLCLLSRQQPLPRRLPHMLPAGRHRPCPAHARTLAAVAAGQRRCELSRGPLGGSGTSWGSPTFWRSGHSSPRRADLASAARHRRWPARAGRRGDRLHATRELAGREYHGSSVQHALLAHQPGREHDLARWTISVPPARNDAFSATQVGPSLGAGASSQQIARTEASRWGTARGLTRKPAFSTRMLPWRERPASMKTRMGTVECACRGFSIHSRRSNAMSPSGAGTSSQAMRGWWPATTPSPEAGRDDSVQAIIVAPEEHVVHREPRGAGARATR